MLIFISEAQPNFAVLAELVQAEKKNKAGLLIFIAEAQPNFAVLAELVQAERRTKRACLFLFASLRGSDTIINFNIKERSGAQPDFAVLSKDRKDRKVFVNYIKIMNNRTFSLSNKQKTSLLGLCYCEKTTNVIEGINVVRRKRVIKLAGKKIA